MEYFIARAMELGRLSPEQIIQLQTRERNAGRGFMPFEIQKIFVPVESKEHYSIPDDLSAQSSHNQRLRSEIRRNGNYPELGDLPSRNVDKIHTFDEKVIFDIENNRLNLFYMGAKPTRKKITASFE